MPRPRRRGDVAAKPLMIVNPFVTTDGVEEDPTQFVRVEYAE